MSEELPAGDFSAWLAQVGEAIEGRGGSDVPCGGCTACCRSSQFVHIGPEEPDTLAHIPAELPVPAPGLPDGHVVLGYDERGHCPMLVDNACSIYEHRPQACRAYDCRVFAAAGITIDDEDKRFIAERVARWRFSYPTETDRIEHDAVRAAAARLGAHPNATQRAVLAVRGR